MEEKGTGDLLSKIEARDCRGGQSDKNGGYGDLEEAYERDITKGAMCDMEAALGANNEGTRQGVSRSQ